MASVRHCRRDARAVGPLEQLSHLPNVTIRVLAFGGSDPIGPGGFALLHFAPVHGTSSTDIVYMEQLTRNIFVEEEAETYEYSRRSSNSPTKRSTRTLPGR